MAAWKEYRKTLTVAVINPTAEKQALAVSLQGLTGFRTERVFRISGPNEKAKNMPGLEPEVKIEEIKEEFRPGRLTLPPLSITLYELKTD